LCEHKKQTSRIYADNKERRRQHLTSKHIFIPNDICTKHCQIV